MAALHLLVRRRTLVNSVFRLSSPPFYLPVRSSALQHFQRKVSSTSIKAGEVEEVQTPRDSPTTRPASSRSGVHLRKIYVGNIKGLLHSRKEDAWRAEDTLFKYFSKFGEVELMEFPRNKLKAVPETFGFVTFRDAEVAQKLLAEEGPHIVDGQKLILAPLRNKQMAVQEKINSTVFVKNILKNTSKQAVEEHFAQFGEVKRVILAQKNSSDENLSHYYVMFSSSSGARKALEQPMQRIAEQSLESEVKEFRQIKGSLGSMHTSKKLVLRSVPDQLTVENLRDYFQEFGEVECVELLVNIQNTTGVEGSRNVAYVHLAAVETVEEIVQKDNHLINGTEVKVAKHRALHVDIPDKVRHLKLSVEGVPLSTGENIVRRYLQTAFDIVPTGVFFDRRRVLGHNKSPCIIRLNNSREVETVLKEPKVTFDEHPLYFRRLIWKKYHKSERPQMKWQ